MLLKQKTLKNPLTFSGKGLHTGITVNLTIKPASDDYGYKFIRTDLPGQPVIAALAENVVDTSRGTVIASGDARVSTIEHVLAALYALEVDNAQIEVDGPEAPILDGSSAPFVKALLAGGFDEQQAERRYYELNEKLSYTDPSRGVEITIYPDDKLSFDVKVSYPSPFLKNQYASLSSLEQFAPEISDCRTFCFFREIEFLAKQNLIKGGDLDNAIVIVDHDVKQDEIDRIATLFNRHDVKVEKQGVLNNLELKYDNEPARHKLLDLIGDLSLCGMPIRGRVIASHPGHAANVEFAKIIRKLIKKDKNKVPAPKVDIYATPAVDSEGIKKLLPHRYPFLLVDKIISISENQVIGLKNVTVNEEFFLGHFPKEAVMPGVLQIEAMAQCGGVLVLNTVPDPENYVTYFLSIDKIKFRQRVVPGDVLIFKLELLAPIRRGIAHMRAQAFVGDTLTTEGEMMAQVVKKTNV